MSLNFSEEGKFELIIESAQLARGLRLSKRMPRNSGFLTTCEGAVGLDGVLQAIEQLTRTDTSAVPSAFPFPQIFVFINVIIVCFQTAIYEWVSGVLVPKLTTGITAGGPWEAIDFFDYVYLTNGRTSVVRSSESKTYAVSTLAHATAVCNFNGQVIIGAPNVDCDIVTLVNPVVDLGVTTTVHGTYGGMPTTQV
jgi:hypothetical protein